MKIKLTKTFTFFLVAASIGVSCSQKAMVDTAEERVPENRVIYEVFVRNRR